MKPTVMIGLMTKNAERFLPTALNELKKIDYPRDRMRLVVIYGKSHDKTLNILKEFKKDCPFKMEIYEESFDPLLRQYGANMCASIWKDWQELIDEDYFLLFDSDIIKVPTNLINELIKVNADIVAPYIWSENHRHFYDSFMFRLNNIRFHPQDPPGLGLNYPILVDSVGTCFLVKEETFVNTKVTNPYPHITFCLSARNMGKTVVACPYLEIFHVDLEKLGILHNPLDPRLGGHPDLGWATSNHKIQVYRLKRKKKRRK